jgi:enamine deaminase RidA (YjgF/YER057c/UK114 family)
MGRIEDRLAHLGLVLPPEIQPPTGVVLPFAFVNIRVGRVIVSGHGPQSADGALAPPFGQVGRDVTLEQAVESARLTALSMLGSLTRELGTLDRITGWLRVFGMVNSATGFDQQPTVINGFSHLILDVFGPEVGRHARSAVGVAALPFGIPVEIEAEVSIQTINR